MNYIYYLEKQVRIFISIVLSLIIIHGIVYYLGYKNLMQWEPIGSVIIYAMIYIFFGPFIQMYFDSLKNKSKITSKIHYKK